MRKKDRLKSEALVSCKARGHSMGKFKRIGMFRDHYRALCSSCQMSAIINAYPSREEVEISGYATRLVCPKEVTE